MEIRGDRRNPGPFAVWSVFGAGLADEGGVGVGGLPGGCVVAVVVVPFAEFDGDAAGVEDLATEAFEG